MNRGNGIALGGGAHPHGGTILGHERLNARERRSLAVAQRSQSGLIERLFLLEILHLDGHVVDHAMSFRSLLPWSLQAFAPIS